MEDFDRVDDLYVIVQTSGSNLYWNEYDHLKTSTIPSVKNGMKLKKE